MYQHMFKVPEFSDRSPGEMRCQIPEISRQLRFLVSARSFSPSLNGCIFNFYPRGAAHAHRHSSLGQAVHAEGGTAFV